MWGGGGEGVGVGERRAHILSQVQVGLEKGLDGSDILPVPVKQVRLHTEEKHKRGTILVRETSLYPHLHLEEISSDYRILIHHHTHIHRNCRY